MKTALVLTFWTLFILGLFWLVFTSERLHNHWSTNDMYEGDLDQEV